MKRGILIYFLIVALIAVLVVYIQASNHQSNREQPFKDIDINQITEVSKWYPKIEKFTEKDKKQIIEELKNVMAVKKADQENPYEGFWGIQITEKNGDVKELNIITENMFQYDDTFYETQTNMMELAEKYMI